ncbi:MAG TPA: NfeD family protein [Bacteroidales bacterium]|nr:NfeD family protein [Bacteroidales bacterium]
MSLGLIIFLILLGIVLFLVEFLIVPGVTIAGIGGALCIVTADVMAFYFHGPKIGLFVLIGTLVIIMVTVALMLKTGTWKKLMLNKQIDGKIDLVHKEEGNVKTGDKGVTVTRLNPMGRVNVNGRYYEAKALDKLIDQQTEIEVIKVESNKLIVKPLN